MAFIVRDVIPSLDAEARGTSITITPVAPASTALLNVGPVRMREVFTNLISNSLHHTPAGGAVTITVREDAGREERHGSSGRLAARLAKPRLSRSFTSTK